MKMFSGLASRCMMFLAVSLVGCPPNPKPAPHDAADASPPRQDAGPVAEEDAGLPACRRACAQLKKLGCPEAEDTDGGLSCDAVCSNAEATGKFNLRPECLADAGTPEEARACGSVRCRKLDPFLPRP